MIVVHLKTILPIHTITSKKIQNRLRVKPHSSSPVDIPDEPDMR